MSGTSTRPRESHGADAASRALQRTVLRCLLASAMLGALTAVHAQTTAVERGKAKFEHTCAPCHAAGPGDDGRAMLPGTDALRIKYKGELPALIEQRTDLNADAIKTFVRRGTWSMPPFRKTEVTDEDLADIAAYIADSAKRAAAAARRR